MMSVDTLSVVTSTASFFLVPASRRECAKTNAPIIQLMSVMLKLIGRLWITGQVRVAQKQLQNCQSELEYSSGQGSTNCGVYILSLRRHCDPGREWRLQ